MFTRSNDRRARRVDRVAVIIIALTLAGCGGKLSDAEVRAANGVRVGNPETATTSVGGTSPAGAPDTSAPSRVRTPGETGPIVLGNVGTYSGPAGASTAGIPQAVKAWAASVNQRGGLFGREVKVIVQDDGGDPARFASVVRDLVENRRVIAFVGESSLGLKGGTRYLEAKGVPVIGSDCSSTDWYTSKVFFPQCGPINDATAGLGIKAVAKAGHLERLGLVFCTETPICSDGAKTLTDSLDDAGIKVVYNKGISLSQVDFTAACQAAKESDAEMFAVLADAGTVTRFAQACLRQGFRPQYVQPSITTTAKTSSSPGLEKVVLPLQTFPFSGGSSPAFKEFTSAMEEFAPKEVVGAASSYGWSAAKLFELAATKAATASKSLSAKSLLKAMHTVRDETLGGLTVKLDFTGPTPKNAECAFIIKADGPDRWTLPVGQKAFC